MQKQLVGNRYRIKGLIGEGGMASVYAALDEKLDRRVAIKILHQHLARNTDIRERFLLEARTVSNLDHPNIIKVYDFSGLDSEQLWMVSEILYGVDLAEYVKRYPKNRLHPIVAILIAREVCRALHEAHKINIVHRDIKPENIMLLDSGQVKLMDFGIAKVHRAKATLTGTFMGSPSYMSPEQIRGSDVDVRADIYSLSVLFYEIVTGVLPYSGQTTAEVINKIMVGRYTAANLLAPDLPFVINEIINKGLKSPKEERFQDILEMATSLDHFLMGFGFGDSARELEQYTNNRLAFDERLAKLKLPRTSVPKIESHKNILDQSKPPSSRSHHTAVAPSVDPNAETRALQQPQPSRSGTPTPGSAKPVDGNHNNAGARSHAPHPQKPGNQRPGTTSEMPTQILPQNKPQTYPPPSSPVRPGTSSVPPSSQSSGSRKPTKKAVIREVGSYDRQKKSSSSTYVLLGLVAAIALVFFLGGDKLMNRLKHDSAKVVQQIEPIKKKKAGTREDPQPGVEAPKTDPAPIEMLDTPAVESQTVVIHENKVAAEIDKLPVVTTNKTLSEGAKSKTTPITTAPASAADKSKAVAPTEDSPPAPVPTPVSTPNPAGPPVLASVPEKTTAPTTDHLPPEPPKKGEPGMLRVSALPAAEIFIDSKPYGTTNDPEISGQGIRLDAGTYTLRLKRKGYKVDEQQIQIKAGEQKNLNVTLLKTVDLVELTIRTNRKPTQLIIEDLNDGGRRKEMNMTRQTLSLNLRPGKYRVTVTYEQEKPFIRDFVLKENDESQTFTADFK